MLGAVAYVHAKRVVHRDTVPVAQSFLGTPLYAAPEIYKETNGHIRIS